MIQKKISLVGSFGTGKTSLVRRFVHSRFSEAYHATIGVKVDRKTVELATAAELDAATVNLILWDLAGRDDVEDVPTSYLRGSAGLFFVVDGTRRATYEAVFELKARAEAAIGAVPAVVALNKTDLTALWDLEGSDAARLEREGWRVVQTSAKSGAGVEEAFTWLARETLKP